MLHENVRLSCIANEPIYWRFHVCTTHKFHFLLKFTAVRLNWKISSFYSKKAVYDFEITHNTHANHANKYSYESVLELKHVDYTYVDYYYCVKNTSETNANIETLLRHRQATQIYVFVEDRRRPLVPASVPLLEGNQYDEITIPCRPTSKEFEVQLFKEENVVSRIRYFSKLFHQNNLSSISLNLT